MSETNQHKIPTEAVEAALVFLRRDDLWELSDEEEARLILEAAAPFIRAQALEDAASDLAVHGDVRDHLRARAAAERNGGRG